MPLAEFANQFPGLCKRLLDTRRRDRVAHAYLFVGDDPAFLEQFVRAWFQVCACPEPTGEGDACGSCDSCRLMSSGSYPELLEVRPQSKSRSILVDDVRELEHQLGLTSGPGRRKFGLLVEADRMVEQAQNTFLKTLEEPAPRTILALLTTQPRELLPTIRSRCQSVSLLRNKRSYGDAVRAGLFPLLARLHRNAGAATALSVAHGIARILDGLHSLAEESVGEEQDERWQVLADQDSDLKKKLQDDRLIRIQAEYRRVRRGVLDALQTWFLQVALLAVGTPRSDLPHAELLEAAGLEPGHEPRPPWHDAERDVQLANELLGYLAGNVQERLALEAFCLSVCERTS